MLRQPWSMARTCALLGFAACAAAVMSVGSGCGSDGVGGGGGGGGGASSQSSSSGAAGAGGGTMCTTSADCPATGNECTTPECVGDACVTANVAAGTMVASQIAGDCKKNACDGSGVAAAQDDDSDAPDDADDCTDDACSGGMPVHTPSVKDTPCSTDGGAYCDGAGKCVECTAGGQCASGVCQAGACKGPLPDCQTAIPGGDVTGNWSASVGEQTYLEVQQSGACVTGQTCEHPGQDCYPLQGGVLDGDKLYYYYTFSTFQVDATLTLSADGMTLTGDLYSSKCSCSIPHTYLKQ